MPRLAATLWESCPGCDGQKLAISTFCRSCAKKGSRNPTWKGGPYDDCPRCGGRKLRESKACGPCRTRYQDGKHITAAERQRIFRRTPNGRQYVRKMNLKKYGITPEQYDTLLEQQDGGCAACGQGETASNQFGRIGLAVDHCHTTGNVRGLLCMACNRALGMLGDSELRIEALLLYVQRAKGGDAL